MTQSEVAVLSRSRRVTAGKRMSNLVGKALEDDEEFWNHDTWKEENDGIESDDGSYDLNDEAEENRVDVFDSDFNDSESDQEEGEDENEERKAALDNKKSRKKGNYSEPKNVRIAGRDLLRKKKKKGKAIGSGANAGLILNMPNPSDSLENQSNDAPITTHLTKQRTSTPTKRQPLSRTLASTRTRRRSSSLSPQRALRNATKEKTCDSHQHSIEAERDTVRRARILAQTKKKSNKKKKYTQEELLIEAATETEAENEKWISGRKRVQQIVEERKKIEGAKKDFKVALKFHSKRGCYNTITFPDVDNIPELFQKQERPKKRKRNDTCVITGLKAKYRDPRTGMPYHDMHAFKELRRRHDNGEQLDQGIPKIEVTEKKQPLDTKQHNLSFSLCDDILSTAAELAKNTSLFEASQRNPPPPERIDINTSSISTSGFTVVNADLVPSSLVPYNKAKDMQTEVEEMQTEENLILNESSEKKRIPKIISPVNLIPTPTEIVCDNVPHMSLPPSNFAVIDPPEIVEADVTRSISTDSEKAESIDSSDSHLTTTHHMVEAS